jgi:multisubunit Na+/H+ antiporter MnhF subunit
MIAVLAISAFIVAAVFASIRLLRGPSLADRVIALDVLLMSLIGGIAVHAADTASTIYLDLLVVIAIVGFTTTVAASRYIEHESGGS